MKHRPGVRVVKVVANPQPGPAPKVASPRGDNGNGAASARGKPKGLKLSAHQIADPIIVEKPALSAPAPALANQRASEFIWFDPTPRDDVSTKPPPRATAEPQIPWSSPNIPTAAKGVSSPSKQGEPNALQNAGGQSLARGQFRFKDEQLQKELMAKQAKQEEFKRGLEEQMATKKQMEGNNDRNGRRSAPDTAAPARIAATSPALSAMVMPSPFEIPVPSRPSPPHYSPHGSSNPQQDTRVRVAPALGTAPPTGYLTGDQMQALLQQQILQTAALNSLLAQTASHMAMAQPIARYDAAPLPNPAKPPLYDAPPASLGGAYSKTIHNQDPPPARAPDTKGYGPTQGWGDSEVSPYCSPAPVKYTPAAVGTSVSDPSDPAQIAAAKRAKQELQKRMLDEQLALKKSEPPPPPTEAKALRAPRPQQGPPAPSDIPPAEAPPTAPAGRPKKRDPNAPYSAFNDLPSEVTPLSVPTPVYDPPPPTRAPAAPHHDDAEGNVGFVMPPSPVSDRCNLEPPQLVSIATARQKIEDPFVEPAPSPKSRAKPERERQERKETKAEKARLINQDRERREKERLDRMAKDEMEREEKKRELDRKEKERLAQRDKKTKEKQAKEKEKTPKVVSAPHPAPKATPKGNKDAPRPENGSNRPRSAPDVAPVKDSLPPVRQRGAGNFHGNPLGQPVLMQSWVGGIDDELDSSSMFVFGEILPEAPPSRPRLGSTREEMPAGIMERINMM